MIEVLVTSSVLIAAVFAVRKIFAGKIPARLQYALWLTVLLRLLVPVSIPALDFGEIAEQSVEEAQPSQESVYVRTEDPHINAEAVYIAPRAPEAEKDRSDINWLFVIWAAGCAVTAGVIAQKNIAFWLRIKKSRTPLDAEGRIYVTSEVSSPCVFGRTIYITPEAAESEEKLRHVTEHEKTHLRHLDPVWSFLWCVCLALYWFDPLVWCAAYASRRDRETACDEGTISRLGERERIGYAGTLLSLVRIKKIPENPLISATTMASGKRQIKERIERIADKKKTAASAAAVVLIIALALCAASFLGCVKKRPLTGEETEYFNEEFFNGDFMNIKNQFLASLYDDVRKIDLLELFYCGTGENVPVTDAEREKLGYDYMFLDADKITPEAMNAVLEKYASVTLEETDKVGLENFDYLPDYDAYYLMRGDTNYRYVTIAAGEKRGREISLYYKTDLWGWTCVTLKEKNGGYVFVSNRKSEKPKIKPAYPKGKSEKLSAEAKKYAAPSVAAQSARGDCADRLDGFIAGENETLVRMYLSTDGNVYAAVVTNDTAEGDESWQAERFLQIPEGYASSYYVGFFEELFGCAGLVISYGETWNYYTFDADGKPSLLVETYSRTQPVVSDLDGDGENELAAASYSGAELFYEKNDCLYRVQLDRKGSWDKNYRCFRVNGGEAYIYFDGENLKEYKR